MHLPNPHWGLDDDAAVCRQSLEQTQRIQGERLPDLGQWPVGPQVWGTGTAEAGVTLVKFQPDYTDGMGRTSIRKFSYLDQTIELIRERKNLSSLSKIEPRLGIQVRYGLKFDGQFTDWSEFVEATEDEASANAMAELAMQRLRALSDERASTGVSPAA